MNRWSLAGRNPLGDEGRVRMHDRQLGVAAAPGRVLSGPESAVLRSLLYYEAFGFPLRLAEIERLSNWKWKDVDEVEETVGQLEARALLKRLDGDLFGVAETEAELRLEGERGAARALPIARRWCSLIAAFPWVRGVALTGTLSKGVLHKGDDVDFFVVTAPGRVWLCRTVLMLFKKVFLLNSHRWFCINYLVDEDHLEITDRNLFVATEIAWLQPVVGRSVWQRFFEENDWIESFFARWTREDQLANVRSASRKVGILERLMPRRAAEILDDWCRRRIEKRNRRRYGPALGSDYERAMRAQPGVSKHHPGNYQSKVLDRHQARLRAFDREHGTNLAGTDG